jgi:hypothetical protein
MGQEPWRNASADSVKGRIEVHAEEYQRSSEKISGPFGMLSGCSASLKLRPVRISAMMRSYLKMLMISCDMIIFWGNRVGRRPRVLRNTWNCAVGA